MPVTESTKETTSKPLQDKIALVTGGSRGIGAAIASRLAREGATSILTYAKNKNAAESVVDSITSQGFKAVAIRTDITDLDSIRKLAKEVEERFGRIDILVNNAGVWAGGAIEEVSIEQYNEIFDVNVKGLIAATTSVLRLIPEGGRIINISSVASTYPMAGVSIYSASKAAIDALTRGWAQDLGERRITVNTLAPGVTETDMMHQALPVDVQKVMTNKTALGRIGTGYDIASVIAFLASDDGGWITGQYIRADGGIV